MTHRWKADRGIAVLLVALVLAPVLLASAAIVTDLGRWMLELQRAQRAADAAALAAAPLWESSRSAARLAALAAAQRNGLPASRVAVAAGSAPGRVRVTVTTPSRAVLGRIVGGGAVTLSRAAEAAYAAPVPMGSSCNLFGDEPAPAVGDGSDPADGSGSAVSPACLLGRRPHLWATIAGPDTSKVHGDRYASRWCDPGNTACSGRTNLDYDAAGADPTATAMAPPSYFLRITVRRAIASMAVQLFDPAMVDVGAWCERLPRRSATDPAWPGPNRANRYVADATRRYESGNPATSPPASGAFCTGDDMVTAPGTPGAVAVPVVTSFAVHEPTPSTDPWRARVIPACVRQYRGWSPPTGKGFVTALTSTSYLALQRVFRQWVTVCTIRAPRVGDYFLQVRTNVALEHATAARMADPREDASARGTGQNRFAVRVDATDDSAVTVSAVERMAVYANLAGTASSLLLARVGSASAGGTLRVELFDIGDSDGAAVLRILPPSDASGSWPASCLAFGDVRGAPSVPASLPGCRLAGITYGGGYNGRVQRIDVPVPADYRCRDPDPTGCWYKVRLEYVTALYDATTWSAWMEGDPVRLVS